MAEAVDGRLNCPSAGQSDSYSIDRILFGDRGLLGYSSEVFCMFSGGFLDIGGSSFGYRWGAFWISLGFFWDIDRGLLGYCSGALWIAIGVFLDIGRGLSGYLSVCFWDTRGGSAG